MERVLTSFFQIGDIAADSVASFELVRELGKPTVLDIEVRFANSANAENALGLPGYLSFGVGGAVEQEFAGIVESLSIVASASTGAVTELIGGSANLVRFRVVSQIALLRGAVTAQIFQEKKTEEIVSEVLAQFGIPKTRQRWQLAATYEPREVCVQYFEDALSFVSRLLEEDGIFFRSIVEEGEEIIVFSDDSINAPPIEGAAELPVRGQSGLTTDTDSIFALRERAATQSGMFTLRDYDLKKPKLDLTASAEAKHDMDLERYDYPGLYVEKARGVTLATVRLESEQINRETVDILAECARLQDGTQFNVTEYDFENDRSQAMLVTRVRHIFGHGSLTEDGFAEIDGKTPSGYVASAHLIPIEVPYRTPQRTPRPIIHGPQTATVTCPSGSSPESIHTDEYGRCKVKFHWDLTPNVDEKTSCWIRTAQMQTSGSLALPRIGWEVMVEFLEGNPDRPVVTGKVYNGLFMPPYALPAGKTRTAFSSNSSPGAGGSNSIRLEDQKGGEEIMIHAQYDQNLKTANNKSSTVGNNTTRVVGANETIDVGANMTTKITMGSQLTVGADRSVSVSGNRNNEVNAVTNLMVGGSSSTSIGGNHFEMDGNPLEALLAIATEVVIEAAQAAASEAMGRINEAVQSRVDQVMGPVNDMVSQVEQVGAAMEAVANGDIGAIAEIAAGAAGVPMPPGFGDGGAEAGGGEGQGGESEGGEEDGGSEEEGPADYTGMVGLNSAVDSAIDRGIRGGAGALGEALGITSAGGDQASMANVDGPAGDAAGLDETDRTKGPGHNLHLVSGNYTEDVGSLRIQGVLLESHDEIGGNLTETIGLAKLTAALADQSISIGGNKTLTALGRLTYTKGDESEAATGAVTNMVGGLVYDKVKGGYSITAGAPATFVGAFHKIEAKTAITLSCGASTVVIDGSGVTIESPIVTITCAKITMTKTVAEN